MKTKTFFPALLILFFVGCDTMYTGSILVEPVALEKSKSEQAFTLFKQFVKEHDYTLEKPEYKGNETILSAHKKRKPHLSIRVTPDAIVIEVFTLGGWWAPPEFDKTCDDLLALYQKKFGKDKVKLIKK